MNVIPRRYRIGALKDARGDGGVVGDGSDEEEWLRMVACSGCAGDELDWCLVNVVWQPQAAGLYCVQVRSPSPSWRIHAGGCDRFIVVS